MNYNDPENILLIVCGAMGIAVLALLLRYVFLSFGFDTFGANTIFFVSLILGIIFFIYYLQFIQHISSQAFGKKTVQEPTIKQQDTPSPSLDELREQHLEKNQKEKSEILKIAIDYTQQTFAPYTSDEGLANLTLAITNYFDEIEISKPIQLKGLSNGDLFHFGWNIWNHFKPIKRNKQEDISIFLKIVFEKQLKDIEVDTIRKKLTFDEGHFNIELLKKLDSI